ncbi:MAG TPA: DUF1540 domain-containing protein [Candidatus Pelethenecus faecipullorum]|uniref:DUF1540 domain-containing protein n=1 Tax=Candidatus Pelethenecus faecipullorum TaxID=2840900 RepID=A0A9D1GRQ0_9MOLU|nr:DUF1540 domain-containing protein [Candidatus Pelethenecus faecipullorum]
MTKVSCNAKSCGYNENCECLKKHIDVEGLFAKSKIGTFCQSFKNPHRSDVLMTEMAREMTELPHAIKVECSANYCAYNENNLCVKENIQIGNENAQYRSETQCDSFRSR